MLLSLALILHDTVHNILFDLLGFKVILNALTTQILRCPVTDFNDAHCCLEFIDQPDFVCKITHTRPGRSPCLYKVKMRKQIATRLLTPTLPDQAALPRPIYVPDPSSGVLAVAHPPVQASELDTAPC